MIAATDLCLALDGRVILDHVSFKVARGESVALVGPNGSGKTSILRCLLGLVPFAGRVVVEGHDVVREPVLTRSLLAYVPQKAAFGDASAAEVLAFVATLRRIDRARITETLRAVGLDAHANQRLRTFSGGMQQRLSLAVALLADPPVLLLDEPSASLDRDGQETFFESVARLREDGRTLLLASHRPEEVEWLTDRVVHIDRGRVVAEPTATSKRARVIPLAGTVDFLASGPSRRRQKQAAPQGERKSACASESNDSQAVRAEALEARSSHLSTVPAARGDRR